MIQCQELEPNITLGSGGRINSYDDYHYIQISQPTDTLTIQEYGKIIFSIGTTKTEIGRINSTGLLITGLINTTTNLQENGTNLSAKYLALSGGTISGILILSTAAGNNPIFINSSYFCFSLTYLKNNFSIFLDC